MAKACRGCGAIEDIPDIGESLGGFTLSRADGFYYCGDCCDGRAKARSRHMRVRRKALSARKRPEGAAFRRWAQTQIGYDDPVGDIARDVVADSQFPRGPFRDCVRYVERNGCDLAVAAFIRAFDKFADFVDRGGKVPPMARSSVTPGLRFHVFRRDGYRCRLCGRTADDGVKLEVDHIHPVARGGKTVYGNLWTLCFDCNRGKRDSLL